MRSRAGLAELRPAYLEFRAVLGLQCDEGRIARVDHLARGPVHLDCIARVQPLGGRYSLQFLVGHASIPAKGVPWLSQMVPVIRATNPLCVLSGCI